MRVFRNNIAFEDYLLNQLCDSIFEIANEGVAKKTFMLTGLAAYFLQQGTDNRPLKNIIFKTTDINIYNLVIYQVGRLNVLNMIKYSNRILFEFEGQFQRAFVEIWIDPDSTEVENLNGIICEKYNRIKPIML